MSLDFNSHRRLEAKRTNERIKLAYSTLNAFAIGIAGAALIVPGVSSMAALLDIQKWFWILFAGALNLGGAAVRWNAAE